MSFHLGGESSTIDLAREARRPTSTAPWTRPTASCGRTAGGDPVRVAGRGRASAASQGAGARGDAATDRGRRLRSVGLRRHARRAHRRDRADCRDAGRSFAAAAGSRSSAAAGRCVRCAVPRCRRRSVRSLSVLPHELPAAVERIQADGKQARKTIARLQSELAVHEAVRLIAASPVVDGVRRAATSWTAGTPQASRQSPRR